MSSTVVILGSPRKGNSDAIAEAVAEGAKANGNEIKTFKLNKLDAKGCQSCYGCKKTGKCVVKDEMAEVLEAVREADSLILATPDYFGQRTAQYRMFEDRTFSFLGGDFVPNIAAGKKVAVVVTCGSGLDGAKAMAADIEGVWKNFFRGEVVGSIVRGNMMAPDAAANDKALMEEAKALGKKL